MNPKILRGCDKLRDSSERRKRFVLGTELRTIESVGWLVRELSTPWGAARIQEYPFLTRWVREIWGQVLFTHRGRYRSKTLEMFDVQSVLMSSGYQFMTIVLDIGSTETASAVKLTWKIICWVITRSERIRWTHIWQKYIVEGTWGCHKLERFDRHIISRNQKGDQAGCNKCSPVYTELGAETSPNASSGHGRDALSQWSQWLRIKGKQHKPSTIKYSIYTYPPFSSYQLLCKAAKYRS